MPNPPLRNTRQRSAILDYLRHTTSHPTAEQVHRAVRRRIPSLGLATVYRNLEKLVERGLAIRFEGPDGRRRYDADTRPHYHIVCTRCGRVGDVHTQKLEIDIQRLEKATDYQITGFELELRGLCPKCRRAGARGRRPARNANRSAEE